MGYGGGSEGRVVNTGTVGMAGRRQMRMGDAGR